MGTYGIPRLSWGTGSLAAGSISREQRRETTLAHGADGVILLGPDGLVEYANPAAPLLLYERVLDVTRRLLQPDLDRLDRVRRDFVANVSHELKTPVAGIRALADVASSAAADGDEETAGAFIQRLQSEAERLGRLVGDLLDLSRVESGTKPEREPVDVRGILEGAVDRIRELAEPKGIAVKVTGERIKVSADPSQLAMAVRNLADNAVRHSEAGTIRLGVGAGVRPELASGPDPPGRHAPRRERPRHHP